MYNHEDNIKEFNEMINDFNPDSSTDDIGEEGLKNWYYKKSGKDDVKIELLKDPILGRIEKLLTKSRLLLHGKDTSKFESNNAPDLNCLNGAAAELHDWRRTPEVKNSKMSLNIFTLRNKVNNAIHDIETLQNQIRKFHGTEQEAEKLKSIVKTANAKCDDLTKVLSEGIQALKLYNSDRLKMIRENLWSKKDISNKKSDDNDDTKSDKESDGKSNNIIRFKKPDAKIQTATANFSRLPLNEDEYEKICDQIATEGFDMNPATLGAMGVSITGIAAFAAIEIAVAYVVSYITSAIMIRILYANNQKKVENIAKKEYAALNRIKRNSDKIFKDYPALKKSVLAVIGELEKDSYHMNQELLETELSNIKSLLESEGDKIPKDVIDNLTEAIHKIRMYKHGGSIRIKFDGEYKDIFLSDLLYILDQYRIVFRFNMRKIIAAHTPKNIMKVYDDEFTDEVKSEFNNRYAQLNKMYYDIYRNFSKISTAMNKKNVNLVQRACADCLKDWDRYCSIFDPIYLISDEVGIKIWFKLDPEASNAVNYEYSTNRQDIQAYEKERNILNQSYSNTASESISDPALYAIVAASSYVAADSIGKLIRKALGKSSDATSPIKSNGKENGCRAIYQNIISQNYSTAKKYLMKYIKSDSTYEINRAIYEEVSNIKTEYEGIIMNFIGQLLDLTDKTISELGPEKNYIVKSPNPFRDNVLIRRMVVYMDNIDAFENRHNLPAMKEIKLSYIDNSYSSVPIENIYADGGYLDLNRHVGLLAVVKMIDERLSKLPISVKNDGDLHIKYSNQIKMFENAECTNKYNIKSPIQGYLNVMLELSQLLNEAKRILVNYLSCIFCIFDFTRIVLPAAKESIASSYYPSMELYTSEIVVDKVTDPTLIINAIRAEDYTKALYLYDKLMQCVDTFSISNIALKKLEDLSKIYPLIDKAIGDLRILNDSAVITDGKMKRLNDRNNLKLLLTQVNQISNSTIIESIDKRGLDNHDTEISKDELLKICKLTNILNDISGINATMVHINLLEGNNPHMDLSLLRNYVMSLMNILVKSLEETSKCISSMQKK